MKNNSVEPVANREIEELENTVRKQGKEIEKLREFNTVLYEMIMRN